MPRRLTTVPIVAELIRDRAHLAARPLRQRLVQVPFGLDNPYWEDDPDFAPERHITEIGLPRPAPNGSSPTSSGCSTSSRSTAPARSGNWC